MNREKVTSNPKKNFKTKTSKTGKKPKKPGKISLGSKALQFAIVEHFQTQIEVYLGTKFVVPFDKSLRKDQKVVFDKVLVTNESIGDPYLKNFVVVAKCLEPDIKDKKIIVFKYKAKKNYRVKTGHRQHWSLLMVEKFQKKTVKKKN